MRPRQGILMLLALLALAACAGPGVFPTATTTPYLVAFNVSRISVEPSGKAHIELGVANNGAQELPAASFVAHFELSDANGRLRAGQDAVLPRIPPSAGGLTTVVNLHTPLEAGAYQVSWGAPGLGSTLVTFEIVTEDGALRLGKEIVDVVTPGLPGPDSRVGQ